MNEVHIRVNDKGRHQPYRLVNGLYALDVGPAFVAPRDAIDYANRLEGIPVVSPLRPSAGRITADRGAPASGSVGLVRPADAPRQGTSRPGRMTGRE